MSSRILRNIVAGPRAPHPEANLDLCYVTDHIIATSGPSATYPSRAYRNPLDALVKFLDTKHGEQWCIWEFRAEGTGYPDEAVYGRIWHFPWPDHHPPPFALIPRIMASMRDWLHGESGRRESVTAEGNVETEAMAERGPARKGGEAGDHRVVVVHCKAGKGRSGSMATSYMISEEGWTREDAMARFTSRRMRPGFGSGISIPSQLRWLTYVERWKDHSKRYIEQSVEITEVHVWGLRDGVKIAIEGYEDEGRRIRTFHTFTRNERDDVADDDPGPAHEPASNDGIANAVIELMRQTKLVKQPKPASNSNDTSPSSPPDETSTKNVIFRPRKPLVLPTNEVNLACERRSRAAYSWTLVTSVAHVWFNAFFEGRGPEHLSSSPPTPPDSNGVFEIEWDAMDGIKGSARKGARAFDRVSVVWRISSTPSSSNKDENPTGGENEERPTRRSSIVINEPPIGAAVRDSGPADWRGGHAVRDEHSPGGGRQEIAHNVTKPSFSISKEEGGGNGEDGSEGGGGGGVDGGVIGKIRDEEEEDAGSSDDEAARGIQRGVVLPEDKKE